MNKILNVLILLSLPIILASCANSGYKDGSYTGKYDNEAGGGMVVNLEIKDGKITSCDMIATDKTGNIKDENYAKDSSETNYEIAQRSVKEMKKYPQLLIDTQNVDEIDSISGASLSYNEFKVAVKDALNKAK